MKFSIHKSALITVFLLSQLICNSPPISAEHSGAEETEPKRDTFKYKIENRSDPFLPFGSRTVLPPGPTPSVVPPPIINYKLVGIMLVDGVKIAVVEDASGKGYYLTQGTRLGSRVVSRIEESRVYLVRSYTTKTGRVVTREYIMHLKKEGDK